MIVIVCKKLLIKQMKHLGFKFKINQINLDNVSFKKLNNNFTFEANHIHEECHFTLYGLSPE